MPPHPRSKVRLLFNYLQTHDRVVVFDNDVVITRFDTKLGRYSQGT